jgi:RHS repeat-associated protein
MTGVQNSATSPNNQYQGSQAFNHNFIINESINQNTGSLVLSKSLVNLKGINPTIDLTINLAYSAGTAGILNLPNNWSLGISYIIPNISLTCQGKTSVIDLNWSDSTGYQSGLRYVNDHGVKFQEVIPPQPLLSGQPGTYSYQFTYNDGACDYFDGTGKLIEHDDIFGNHINYYYTDQFSGVFGNYLDRIVDSFGQTITFSYEPNAIVIGLPNGSRTTINYSSRGVENVIDDFGYQTVFDYTSIADLSVVSTIHYPTGLVSQIQYITISYLTSDGGQKSFPAVSELVHLSADLQLMDSTIYAYGTDTAGNTYTGANAGYILSSSADSLMDSNNTAYQYDVLITRVDGSGNLLTASRVYYNYLHLPLRAEQYLANDSSGVSNGYQTCYTYSISADWHARTTNYSRPVTTEQFVWSSDDGKYIPMRKSTITYDDYGHVLTSEEALYDQTQQASITQMIITDTYTVANWGGEMPETTVHQDNVSGYATKINYQLTSDQKNISSAAIEYKSQTDNSWNPWKTKNYKYDQQGRVTSTILSWSPGSSHDSNSISSSTENYAYAYNESSHILQVTLTDALGNNTTYSYDVSLIGGPVVELKSPLGEETTYKYDVLSRIIKKTDPEGYVTSTAYYLKSKDGYNGTVSVAPNGYTLANYFDALGRKIKVMDNGDPTQTDGNEVNRTLSQASYNLLGLVSQNVNELGLVFTYQYDSLGRLIESTDPLGNVSTTQFDDAKLSSSNSVNGVLRQTIQKDGLGRTVAVNQYPDPDDENATYYLAHQIQYNGLGQKLEINLAQLDLKTEQVINPLNKLAFSYDVESKVVNESFVGYVSTQVQSSRTTVYDLLGHELSYSKQTTYSDGKTYTHSGNINKYNNVGQLISTTNALGQVESYAYNADGRLQKITRFDGTEYNYTYDKNGHLTAQTWSDNSKEYTYYGNGATKSISDGSATINYDYYLDGSAKSITYPDGKSQSYQLDQYSRVIRQRDASGAATTNAFNDKGLLIAQEHGGDKLSFTYGTINHTNALLQSISLSGNQTLNRQYGYDGFGQLSSAVVSNEANQVLLGVSYNYDALARLLEMAVSSELSNDASVNLQKVFTYDGLNQLVTLKTTYQDQKQPDDNVTFSYDGNSNVLSRSENGQIKNYQYNALNQLQIPGIIYDSNGRMTDDGSGNHYTYNELDQLTQVITNESNTIKTYSYYPDGALATIVAGQNKQQIYYNVGAANAILSSGTSSAGDTEEAWTTFLFSAGERVAAYETNQSPFYYIAANGSTLLTQEESGGFTGLNYDAYGSVLNNARIDENKSFTWNQEYSDPATGLVYLRSRFYNPSLMSFMTMDSHPMDNRYGYCNGNPINLIDPTGHSPVAGIVVGAIVGIAATVVTGGIAGAAAAAVFGTECVAASIGATAFAGAVGSVAGDATTAGINGEKFTGTRALIDIAAGAAGGAVGAGVGGSVGRVAMRAALSRGMSQEAITNIGLISSGFSGGIAGSLAASGVTAGAYHQPFFSASTAISLAIGAAAGVGGGFLTSGAYLGKMSSKLIPVPLTDADVALGANTILPAVNEVGAVLPNKLLVMAPQNEAITTVH